MPRISPTNYVENKNKEKLFRIWNDSPCTISFPFKLPYLEKANRFQYNSIYYRDDPSKPALRINQFQRPDLLLLDFRRSIREAGKTSKISQNRISSMRITMKRKPCQDNRSQKENHIIERLFPKNSRPLKLEFDFHGNRSSFFGMAEKKKDNHTTRKFDSFFTEGERIDMSRPENFNPGPGTYFNGEIRSSKKFNRGEDTISKNSAQKKKAQHRKMCSNPTPKAMQLKEILTNKLAPN